MTSPNTYGLRDIKGYDSLEELALDLSWTWNKNHAANEVWKYLNHDLWQLNRNPWVILRTSSREKLEKVLSEPEFRQILQHLEEAKQEQKQAPTWFQKTYPQSPFNCVAYFSMEFMLSEALPIYSGGLGNVAGDQLKAASDLGIPVIGIGLLYQQGYFRQVIDKDGFQRAFYPFNSPEQLPITPLRRANGEWLRLEIALPGWSVWLRAWEVKVGKVKLYLLDSNDGVNYPPHRGITSELYGGDSEMRLTQELVLGIGGWRLLECLGIKPDVCHLNEGHASFAILERARSFMKEHSVPFGVALAATRAGNLFTTHTAVPAGFDRFKPAFIQQYLGKYAENELGISLEELLALGRFNPSDSQEEFNMAYLAIRGSGAINGVSELHGRVSRHLFASLFPRWPVAEVPVGSVTNGVHVPSWGSVRTGNLLKEFCGDKCWLGKREVLETGIRSIPIEKLWAMRNDTRRNLVDYARRRLGRHLAAQAAPPELIEFAKHIFDPGTLTLGFARRFATYKRPNLLLHDPERLLKILTNPTHPVQLIMAGKAHPADKPGQALIQQWIQFVRRPEVRPHIIFLGDYDVHMSEHLVHGVDVWINTPRRPWEACGTSGMKVLVNGGINLSELDGWWVEAYNDKVGWALGDGKEHGDDPAWDAAEAHALYDIIEQQVVPEFYNRNEEGIPVAWVHRVRESMAQLTPRFSADRTVIDYTKLHYVEAAKKYKARSDNQAEYAKKIVEWENKLKSNWPSLRFGETKVETKGTEHQFDIQVYLNDLGPDAVKVELYIDENPPALYEMQRIKELPGTAGMHLYRVNVPNTFSADKYTARVIPHLPGVSTPLETYYILWQR